MAHLVTLDQRALDWREVAAVAKGAALTLGESAQERVLAARRIVDRVVADGVQAYGINTGLGALCDRVLDPAALAKLSLNTLKSHACGVGTALDDELVRAIMCAQVANYSHGKSGISPALVDGLVALLNHNLIPVVPSRGSVGYLTHMAHIGLTLTGLCQLRTGGLTRPAIQALEDNGLTPVTPAAKDGLSLVNGTPCMTGLLCVALARAERLQKWADIIAAMSFEALRGQLAAFDEEALALKPYAGAQTVGRNLRALLQDSLLLKASQGQCLQDALSLRAIPQVHGATQLPRPVSSESARPVAGLRGRPVGRRIGGTGRHRRAPHRPAGESAGQRLAAVPGGRQRRQLRTDDRAVRGRIAGGGKQSAVAADGGR